MGTFSIENLREQQEELRREKKRLAGERERLRREKAEFEKDVRTLVKSQGVFETKVREFEAMFREFSEQKAALQSAHPEERQYSTLERQEARKTLGELEQEIEGRRSLLRKCDALADQLKGDVARQAKELSAYLRKKRAELLAEKDKVVAEIRRAADEAL